MFTCLLYYPPVATETNYQKLSGSKYHKFIFLNFGGHKSKLFPYLAAFLLEALREKLFPGLFYLLVTICVPGLELLSLS